MVDNFIKNIIVILHLLVCSLNEEPQMSTLCCLHPFDVWSVYIYIYSHEHINLFMYII
jgi:hypothetical protein